LLQQHIKFSLVEFHHAISQNDLSDDALAGMNYFQLRKISNSFKFKQNPKAPIIFIPELISQSGRFKGLW